MKSDNSDGFIFLSWTLIFLDLAISITVRLVMPSKNESGIGVCISSFLSLKKIFAPVASATEPTNLPVDVEHVLAALVLAARKEELNPNQPISEDDPALVDILVRHVKTVFAAYNGTVGTDD